MRPALCLAAILGVTAASATARAEPSKPLTLATPAAAPLAPTAPASHRTSPPVATPPKRAERPTPASAPKTTRAWYGWQVLVLHGVIDAVSVAGLVATSVEPGKAGGFIASALTPIARGFGSWLLESANGNERHAILYGLTNFLVPLIGAGVAGGIAGEGRTLEPSEDVQPEFAQGFIGGMLFGGSIMTAIESSVAFDEPRPVFGLIATPTFVGVNASGMF